MSVNIFDEFHWRGLIYDATEGVKETLDKERVNLYIGFDPSAKSLHVGSFLQIMCLARLQRAGHTPIAIAGGGTGLIGDPSGKTKERVLLTNEQINENLSGIQQQLSRFLDFETKTNPAKIVNNADWLTTIQLTDFLRDIGKHFTVNYMLSKESVKRRLEQEEGISFTEFAYMLLQAYDFLMVYDRLGCRFQMGGSDQWGNITAGIELIRRLRGVQAYGLVFPLVTSALGIKFGKTEAGTVWLDAELTSPYQFYQFWLNTDDRDAITYLKYYTWLSSEDIATLEHQLQTEPDKREAQRKLAQELTRMVHGESTLKKAEHASLVLFGEEISDLSAKDILDIFRDVPTTTINKSSLGGEGMLIADLLVQADVAPSKGEARRLIQGGGVSLNNRRLSDPLQRVDLSLSIEGQFLVLRKGRKNYHLVRLLG